MKGPRWTVTILDTTVTYDVHRIKRRLYYGDRNKLNIHQCSQGVYFPSQGAEAERTSKRGGFYRLYYAVWQQG